MTTSTQQTNSPQSGVVAESSFGYQPPADNSVSEQADFQQSLKDIVSEIESEYVPDFTDEELAEGDEPDHNQDVRPQPQATEDTVEPQDSPEIARGMERLVAREVALQAKEAEFQTRFARVQALESELAQLRKAVPSQKLMEDLDLSPTEALKAMGKDPETVVRMMIAEQLVAKGQEVPAELREFVKEAKRDREIRDLKAQIAAKNQAEQAQAEFNTVKLGALEYVKTFVGDSKDAQTLSKSMPTLAGIAKDHPEYAQQEIMEEIQRDAQNRLEQGADPSSQALTYIEAAKRVEARLAKMQAIFIPKVPASTAPTKQAQAGAKQTPPQSKPPAAPLKPWLRRDDDIEAQAIREAEREFHLQEARARKRA